MSDNLLRIGRVLHEDDAFVTVEVCKDIDRPLKIEDGDQFWTLVFVHDDDSGVGHAVPWLPWEA